MINVLAICPNRMDSTSFYRGMGPLGELKRRMPDLNISLAGEVEWSLLELVDVLFLQRPTSDQHLLMAKIAKDEGVPVWVDFDDDLFNVPTDNPSFNSYNSPGRKQASAEATALADVVTVSTNHLKQALKGLNEDIRVIPNAMPDKYLRHRKVENRNDLVLWRGSNTHQRDLASLSKQIIEAYQKQPKWAWHFQGWNPWFITESMRNENCFVGEPMPIAEFFKFLGSVSPKVSIVPLHDSSFNRSKSNIAWIEASFAGAACLVPDWEEWKKPGAITYRSKEMFQVYLEKIMTPDFDSAKAAATSWEYICDELLLSKINGARESVVRQLVEKRRSCGV